MKNVEWVPIVSIELDGEEECQCIAVSHSSRLYIGEGGIVTHNTTVAESPATQAAKTVERIGKDALLKEQPNISFNEKSEQLEFFFASLHQGSTVTTPAQVAAGQGSSNRLVGGLQISKEALANTLSNVPQIDFIGETITSKEDLANRAQALRNPGFETFYLLAMRGDVAVDVMAISSRIPYSANIFTSPNKFGDWQTFLTNSGADGFYLIHNHPSGDTTPSPDDIQVTSNITASVPGFVNRGHVITNHKKFRFLDASGTDNGEFHLPSDGSPDPFGRKFTGEVLGKVTADPNDVAAMMAKMHANATSPDSVSIIFTNTKLQVVSTAYISKHDVGLMDMSAIRNYASEHGIANVAFGVPDTATGNSIMNAGWNGFVLDIIVFGKATSFREDGVLQSRYKLFDEPLFGQRVQEDQSRYGPNLGTTYRTVSSAVMELQEGMEWARSTREQRTVDGETVPDTAYDVRTDIAMLEASEVVMDSLSAEGVRGPALMAALRNRNLGGTRLDMDERQILIRHMIQTGRFHELGVSRRELMSLMQEGAGKGAMAMREMREVLDPIERLRQEAETRTRETVQQVTGQDAEALQGQMETEVMAAQETAVNAELEKLRAEASDMRKALDQHKADLSESRENATKERLQREAEVKRLQNLLNLTEQQLAELEARPADSAEANERLAEEVLKARERAAELRREIRDLETELAEEKARADQQLEVGVAIGREEGRAEADADWAARQPEAQLGRFEQWLMGEQIDGIERVETFARRYLQASRFDAEGFGQAVATLFPAVDPHILEDAMDRVAVSLSNSAAAARRREIQNFVDRLAGRVKPKDQEKLGRFLGSLQRASDFGILDADVFTDAFAHAFELNGMTPAVAQQLLNQWHDINRLDDNGNRVHFGMVRETLEREFLEAVNAVAPGARWDNFIFNQYQSAVLSSISSGINQFSGIFRSLVGIDAVARLAARGNYNPADMMAEWWRNVSDLFSNLPFVLTGLRGESLGHMGAQVRGNFSPTEQQLQFARNQQVRMRLPGGRTVTLPNGAAKLLRLKEMWSWRIIRAAEGLSGITDAQARFRDTLAAHYQAGGMSAGQARARALSDIAASPVDRAAAEAQARAEQSAGRIARGQTVVRRRVEEIIQNKIDLRANEELTARAEHLTAAAQFKTMPTGALGYMIASTFKAMTNPSEGGGRVARFLFLFGRFMGHTVDVTLGYMPGAHLATLGRERGTTRRHEVIKEVYGSVEAYNNQQRGKAIAGGSFMVATAALQALAAAMGDDDEEPFFAITGFAPTADPAAKERLKATGQWDEGQIRIGGRPILNYSQLPELVPLLTILGNVSDYLRFDSALYRRSAGEGEAGSQAMSGGEVTGAVAGDVLLAPLKRSTYKQWVAALDSLMKGRVTDSISNIATTPLGGALRVPVLVDADKVAREIDGARDAKGLVENTLRRIPFVTIGEKMYNPYGEHMPGFDVLGMFPSGPKASPEVQRAAVLNLDTRTTRGVPQLNLKYEDGTVREATAEERERYIETSGRYFVQAMLENEADVRQAYAEGKQAAAQKIVGKLSADANKKAKAEVVK